MIPGIQFGLGIYNDKVMIRFVKKGTSHERKREITSVDDFVSFIKEKAKEANVEPDDLIIMCSSSMDFPEDSTLNKKTIKLAKQLR